MLEPEFNLDAVLLLLVVTLLVPPGVTSLELVEVAAAAFRASSLAFRRADSGSAMTESSSSDS